MGFEIAESSYDGYFSQEIERWACDRDSYLLSSNDRRGKTKRTEDKFAKIQPSTFTPLQASSGGNSASHGTSGGQCNEPPTAANGISLGGNNKPLPIGAVHRLTYDEMKARHNKNLCFCWNDKFTPGNRCRPPRTLMIESEMFEANGELHEDFWREPRWQGSFKWG